MKTPSIKKTSRQAQRKANAHKVPLILQRRLLRQLVQDSLSPDFNVRHPSRTLLLAYLYGEPKHQRRAKSNARVTLKHGRG